MGVRNQQRRRAKQKARQQRSRQERPGFEPAGAAWAGPVSGRPFGLGTDGVRPAQVVDLAVGEAMRALHAKNDDAVQVCCDVLVGGPGAGGPRAVDAALFVVLQRTLTAVWRRGWQPADVVRMAQRSYGSRHARVAADVIAGEMRGYAAATVDERWEAQVRDLGAVVWWERDDQYLSALGERDGLGRPELMRCMLEVLYVFNTCPQIEKLCPLPGQARRGSLGAATDQERAVHARQLDRVRALLAKAESTGFPEEAEAYTAKAQELMARHSIDYALLSAGTGSVEEPVGRRVGVDNPYEAPKVLLLDVVARANRCRSVWSSAFGFVTVLGFQSDVDAVEMLFTSLLVQATGAMVRAGSRRDAYGRSSTRSFRQSFLTAYAQRIGERLAKATRQATEQASQDIAGRPGADRLLPVLAGREAKVGELADELFPDLVGKPVPATNREGWASGRAAADRANLNTRDALTAKA
ncbi:MAG TPA: DUF2786 domain-containing protein [Micromonosporaceae bacterium]|nr:DUF2786 domain-containing protein [Micromonosporaceae bacterium]